MATSSRSGDPFPSSSEFWKYDVFLSFRGEDTRRNFTAHLYAALEQAGVRVFIDDEYLQVGNLLKAIEESKISVVVFSQNYASSSWCLDELAKIMECKSMFGQVVLPVFYHVEPSEVRHLRGSLARAFAKHEERFREDLGRVKRWRSALSEAANLAGLHVSNDRSESEVIRNITEHITQLLNPEVDAEELADDGQLVDPEVNVARFPVGIKSRVEDLVRHLDFGSDKVRIVGILGCWELANLR